MEPVDYKKLYLLQDKILDLIFQKDTEFYLTGGTCLNRFYFEKRYSDDLDLFTNFSDTFSYSAREIIDLYLITQNTSFHWTDILAQAKEKLHFQKEDLLYRLQTFPLSLLKKLNTTDDQFLRTF